MSFASDVLMLKITCEMEAESLGVSMNRCFKLLDEDDWQHLVPICYSNWEISPKKPPGSQSRLFMAHCMSKHGIQPPEGTDLKGLMNLIDDSIRSGRIGDRKVRGELLEDEIGL